MANSITDDLLDVFRNHGYQGTTLSKIAEATGLERASLYHRFPGGKQEMAEAVLAEANDYFEAEVIEPLQSSREPHERVRLAVEGLRNFYEDGRKSCLLDVLSLGESAKHFQPQLSSMFEALKDAMATVAKDSGHDQKTAEQLAEEAFIKIQGSLVAARIRGDATPFRKVIERLPNLLLA